MQRQNFPQAARSFVTQQRSGLLATISKRCAGYPFGSIVPYDLQRDGSIIIYVSFIAEHFKNLAADARASLTVADPAGQPDPQAYSRCTLLADFKALPAEESAAIQASYETRFPAAINYEIAHNFTFMRGEIRDVRWIAGFGEMGWINAADYSAAGHDEVAYHARPAIEHMNEDHQEALRDYVAAFAPPLPGQCSLRVVSLTKRGFQIEIKTEGERRTADFEFPQELNDAGQTREAFVNLLKEARAKLGK